jgi:hypothetical protein
MNKTILYLSCGIFRYMIDPEIQIAVFEWLFVIFDTMFSEVFSQTAVATELERLELHLQSYLEF